MAHFPISAHDYISKTIPHLTYGQSKIISSIDSCKYVFIAAAPRAAGRSIILSEYITWEFTLSKIPISFIYGSLKGEDYMFRQLSGYYGRYGDYKNRNNGCTLEVNSISKILDLSRHRGLVPSDVIVLDGLLDNGELDTLYRIIDNSKKYIGRQVKNFIYRPFDNINEQNTYKTYNDSRYIVVCHNPKYEANVLLQLGIDSDEIAIIESKDLTSFNNYDYDIHYANPVSMNYIHYDFTASPLTIVVP